MGITRAILYDASAYKGLALFGCDSEHNGHELHRLGMGDCPMYSVDGQVPATYDNSITEHVQTPKLHRQHYEHLLHRSPLLLVYRTREITMCSCGDGGRSLCVAGAWLSPTSCPFRALGSPLGFASTWVDCARLRYAPIPVNQAARALPLTRPLLTALTTTFKATGSCSSPSHS